MAQTREEKLAYARGYNRARARASDLWLRLAKIAHGYRQRLAEPIMERHCEACSRWTRGGPSCLWGYCRADWDGREPRMWADHYIGDREPRRIVTQAAFGCVNWLPTSSAAQSGEAVQASSAQDEPNSPSRELAPPDESGDACGATESEGRL